MADDLFIHISIFGQTKLARCKEQENFMIELYWRGMLSNIWITPRERENSRTEPVLSHLLFQNILRDLSAFLFCRSLGEWRKVIRKRIDERKSIKSFQNQLMNKKVRQSVVFYHLQTQISKQLSLLLNTCIVLNFEHNIDVCFNNRSQTF